MMSCATTSKPKTIVISHIQHITNKTLNKTPYANQNEFTCDKQEFKPKI
jgi:hypothetical protein